MFLLRGHGEDIEPFCILGGVQIRLVFELDMSIYWVCLFICFVMLRSHKTWCLHGRAWYRWIALKEGGPPFLFHDLGTHIEGDIEIQVIYGMENHVK